MRNYVKTTTRGQYGKEKLAAAMKDIADGVPLIRVSKNYSIPARTLRRHRDGKVTQPGSVNLGRHVPALPKEIEQELHDHIKTMEQSLYGLAVNDVRRLAFDLAEHYGLNHPFSKIKRCAGKDWLQGFLDRFPDLSLRKPQGTNLSRAVGFNKPKVQQFFTMYKELLQKHRYSPCQIWNMDETGISTVHEPGKIIASKGAKQVSKMTSGERGSTVTIICAMSAAGTFLPPMMIFPRKRMVDTLMNGAPPQSVGCCSASGWTDSDLFVKWLEHFAHFTSCSQTAPQIIIMDGHHSHKTLAAILYAREHGISLVTLPPHTTHKMQPLDRTYFKSLKCAYRSECDSWMVANPGQRISFFQVAAIFGRAFLRTATADKAVHGFESCGLWPFNENVFTEEDFAASKVTEEPEPCVSGLNQHPNSPGTGLNSGEHSSEQAETCDVLQIDSSSNKSSDEQHQQAAVLESFPIVSNDASCGQSTNAIEEEHQPVAVASHSTVSTDAGYGQSATDSTSISLVTPNIVSGK